MVPTIGIDDTDMEQVRSTSSPSKDAKHMQDMTTDELAELLTQLELSTEDSRDELLTDFLVRPYPTKSTQDN
jgi:hypothetical protein